MSNYLSPGVYVEELEPASRPIEGVGTAVAAFVGLAAVGPLHVPTLVTNWTQYLTVFGPPAAGTYLGQAVYGYFLNGGGQAYIVRIGGPVTVAEPVADALLPTAADASLAGYRAVAVAAGTPDVRVEVQDADSDAPSDAPSDAFVVVVRAGDQEERFGPVTSRRGRSNVVTVVNQQSRLVRLEETSASVADRRPARGTVDLRAGSELASVGAVSDWTGDPEARTGLAGLEAVDGITMVAVPDLMSLHRAGRLDDTGVRVVQAAVIAHCEAMGDRMAILDPPPDLTPSAVSSWRKETAGWDSKFAALYYPWVSVFDPATGEVVPLPPSGHVAGLWARSDAERGVHKAPANEILRGALGPTTTITRGEHDLLNPAGVNCIRAFPGRGVRVWGARTLSSDPAWRYINVRRLYNYVESSIRQGTQWVVFEPNDKALWERLIRAVRSFLYRVWLDGGLFGDTVDQAFYVKCDQETNPTEIIEAGTLVCEIGLAVVKPAEFIVFRLAQLTTGTSALDE